MLTTTTSMRRCAAGERLRVVVDIWLAQSMEMQDKQMLSVAGRQRVVAQLLGPARLRVVRHLTPAPRRV